MFNRKKIKRLESCIVELDDKLEKMDKLLNKIAEAVLYNNKAIANRINEVEDGVIELEKVNDLITETLAYRRKQIEELERRLPKEL